MLPIWCLSIVFYWCTLRVTKKEGFPMTVVLKLGLATNLRVAKFQKRVAEKNKIVYNAKRKTKIKIRLFFTIRGSQDFFWGSRYFFGKIFRSLSRKKVENLWLKNLIYFWNQNRNESIFLLTMMPRACRRKWLHGKRWKKLSPNLQRARHRHVWQRGRRRGQRHRRRRTPSRTRPGTTSRTTNKNSKVY